MGYLLNLHKKMLVINTKNGNVTKVKLQNQKVNVDKFTFLLNNTENEWFRLVRETKRKYTLNKNK